MRSIPRTILLALPLALSGCDNPLCVYAPDGCQQGGGSGGLGSQPAEVPSTGAWILPSDPVVNRAVPTGTGAHPATPIAVYFSESIAPGSTRNGFELIETAFGVPVPLIQPPPVVGDGRVVILSPLQPLQLGRSYVVRIAEDHEISDLTGQRLSVPTFDVGDFAVAATAPEIPRVIGTWPEDLTVNQSDISEVVVLFDRPMDGTGNKFNTDSFAVTLDGTPPAVNPDPEPLAIGEGSFSAEIESIWTWASADTTGRVTLGEDVLVAVDLSQSGNELLDQAGTALPPTFFEFSTTPFSVPVDVRKATLSDPEDAIGRPNLVDVVPVVEAELASVAEVDDVLELFLFGSDSNGSGELRALGRSITVTSGTQLIEVLPSEIDLLVGGAASAGRFADGDLHVAARMRRGTVRGPVRMLDLDIEAEDVQALLFDVTAPVLQGLGTSGSSTQTFASDQRDLVVVGRANEPVRNVLVSTDQGDSNGVNPEAIFADDSGLFIAAPADLAAGELLDPSDPAVGYNVQVLDRALNASTAVTGTFRQVGGVGPGATPLGGKIDVYVVDEGTLAPLQGALVMSHEDDGGVYTPIEGVTTNGAGLARVSAASPGAVTIVSVDRAGYDLFTFHGPRADVLHVPLRKQGQALATSDGEVRSPFPTVNFATNTRRIGDSRRPDDLSRLFVVDSCSALAQELLYACPFGPAEVLPRRLGAQSFIAYDSTQSEVGFSGLLFLRAFSLRAPIAPLDSGGSEFEVELFVPELLLLADGEDQPIDVDPQLLSDLAATGLGELEGDPLITIEASSPGLRGALTVGAGLAFAGNPGEWGVRAAFAGQADGTSDGPEDELGELVERGAIDGDLFVRSELVDVEGNRTAARPRLSQLAGLLAPPDIPVLLSPARGGSTVGDFYDVVVQEVLPDALGLEGLVRVVLQPSSGGRRWTIWREDPSGDPGTVTLRVPDVGALGGTPLPDGGMDCRVSTFAWEGLDTSAFAWTDVERLHEVASHTATVFFVQN